jgi:hypothetical protein
MASFSLSIALLAIQLNAADSPGGKPASDTTAAPAAKAAAPAPPLRLGPLVVTGSIRSRFESWDWFESPGDSSYGYSGSILRLSVGQKINRMEWMLELAAPVLLGMPDGAVTPAPQGQLGLGRDVFGGESECPQCRVGIRQTGIHPVWEAGGERGAQCPFRTF